MPSSTFDDAYLGVDEAALYLTGVEGWLTAYVKPHLYIRPHFEFSTTVNRAGTRGAGAPDAVSCRPVRGVEC